MIHSAYTTSKHTLISSMVILTTGTGSTYSLEAAPQWQSYLEHRSSLLLVSPIHSCPHIDVRTPKEHLENIRSILNPSISDLAVLLEVSRQSIYKWLSETSDPELEKLENIKILSKIADMFTHAAIKRADVLLGMKNPSGMSLFDLLKNKQPHEKHLKLLIAEAKAMEASYEKMRVASSKAAPTNDWRSSISIPAYQEDL